MGFYELERVLDTLHLTSFNAMTIDAESLDQFFSGDSDMLIFMRVLLSSLI